MKTIQITKEIFENQLNNSEWCDGDCDCFGIEIEGRLYLYFFNGDTYWLTIFDCMLCELIYSYDFLSKMIKYMSERKDDLTDLIDWIACYERNGDNMPFELHDIIYAYCG